jgi:hypothetical protein
MRQQHLRHPAATICAAFLGLLGIAASGQTVYRCGSSYSDVPCAGASTLSIDDSRSPAQKAQTDAATVQARTLAQQMERERLTLEKSAKSASAPATRHKGDTVARPSNAGTNAHAAKAAKTAKKKTEPAFFTAATTPDKKNKVSGSAAD